MIELIIAIVAFLLLIIIIIWAHYLRTAQLTKISVVSQRDETNVRLYHEHKAEIEKDYKAGGIDQENYQYLLDELEKSLLQDIEQNADEPSYKDKDIKNLSIAWPIGLTLFVLFFSFAFYLKTGTYQQVNSAQTSDQAQHHEGLNEEEQILVRIKKLQTSLEKEPENAEIWYELGQTLVGAGDFENALSAFDRVIEIEGEHADLLGAKAQATYYLNNQKIDDKVQDLIDRALALDPTDPSTNILLGMHNFINQHYQKSISYWQRVIDSHRDNVNVGALQEAINQAQDRLVLTGKETGAEEDAKNATQDESTQGPQLVLNISLSDEIAQALSQGEDKIVFVYAVPANGGRMPVAAVKIKASDLPTTIILNNTKAMSPQANLSSVEQVHIYAVVSSTGGVGIKSGDYKAEQKEVQVNRTEPINLIIDVIVP